MLWPRKAGTILRLFLVAIGIALLISWATSEDVVQSLAKANVYLLFGLMTSQISVLVFALRFRWVMRLAKVELTPLGAYKLHLQSLFYQFFVPLSLGSEIFKIAQLSILYPSISKTRLAILVVLDRLVGLVSFLTLALISLPWVAPKIEYVFPNFPKGAKIFITIVLLLTIAVPFVLRTLTRDNRLNDVVALCRRNGPHVGVALLISILMQLVMAGSVYLAALGWQVMLSPTEAVFAVSSAFLFQILPINLAGVGGTEIAGIPIYVMLGANSMQAMLMVSSVYSFRLVSAVLGGLCQLTRTTAKIPTRQPPD